MTTPSPGSVTSVDQQKRASARAVVTESLRAAASVVVLVALYYLLPLRGAHHLSDAGWLVTGLLGFSALAVWQVRGILRAAHPVLRAVRAVAVLVPLYILVFAATYYVMEANGPASFSAALSRTDALYFTVTVFATVGFGDIVAQSETARVLVTLQMIGDLVIIGVLIRVVVTAAQRARRERRGQGVPADGLDVRR